MVRVQIFPFSLFFLSGTVMECLSKKKFLNMQANCACHEADENLYLKSVI